MPDNRKGSEIGLYFLSRSQLVLITAGFAVTCVVAFFMGIVIGQGVEERKLMKQEEPLVKVPIQPPSASAKPGQAPAAKDDQLTFYDTLGKGASAPPPAKLPAAEKSAVADAKPVVEIKPEKKESADARPAKETKNIKTAPADEAPAQKKETKEKTETASKGAEADAAKSDAPRDWTVQVNAFPDERSAQRLADRLKQKGYDAYVVTANLKGRDWYRVRVGHFPARAQAKEYLERLQAKEDFPKAIAVSK
jgi:cell division septation protein DedD